MLKATRGPVATLGLARLSDPFCPKPMHASFLSTPVADRVWRSKYRWQAPGQVAEPSIEASWDRVALAVSSVEPTQREVWRQRFRALLDGGLFLPGGRILARAGTASAASLFNCFVQAPPEDSISGIFQALRETLVTLQAGGGVGIDLSTLRPVGDPAVRSNGMASGPVSWLAVWETASAVLEQGNLRRGALLAGLRCDHPDILAFIQAKAAPGVLPHFNLAVLLSDDFMHAVDEDAPWPLVFPLAGRPIAPGSEVCMRRWSGTSGPQPCRVYGRVPARLLWESLTQALHAAGEPGVLFVDRINRVNNLWFCEQIGVTNPCGEAPMPPYGACNLGSLNLTRFVRHPYAEHPEPDLPGLRAATAVAVRFLDDVIDLSGFPLRSQERTALATRRIGLGVTGLADMLLMLGLRYGSPGSVELTARIMAVIRDAAYRSSIDNAAEKGSFPALDRTRLGASPFVLNLPHALQDAIARQGLRNSHLLAIAPAGSISLLAGNISPGIEPVLAFEGGRRLRGPDGSWQTVPVADAAWRQYRARVPAPTPLPAYFVQAADLGVEEQLRVVEAAQAAVDGAIAKTVQLPASATVAHVAEVVRRAWHLGLKGCTVYRQGSRSDAPVGAGSAGLPDGPRP